VAVLTKEDLFDALYADHRQTLHAYFVGKTGDADLALDLLQDTFVRVWRNVSTLETLSAERQRAWLFSVARNLVIDQYRARATRTAIGQALAREAATANTDAAPVDADLLWRLDAAIRELPENLRTVLVLHALGERSSHEIGELLGRPPGTIRFQLAEARRRLVRALGPRDKGKP